MERKGIARQVSKGRAGTPWSRLHLKSCKNNGRNLHEGENISSLPSLISILTLSRLFMIFNGNVMSCTM